MGLNNVNTEGAEKFQNEVKSHPHAAKKIKAGGEEVEARTGAPAPLAPGLEAWGLRLGECDSGRVRFLLKPRG
ncbi:MAG TPA: hypothetical protein VM658_14755 [bacterium]|nr:hypothetical protein [bacterium]